MDASGFTHASEQTGLPKSTLSRRLTDLKNELGERLLQRRMRRLVVTEFIQKYPDVRLELDLSARRVDLVVERFDVAVRIATQLPDDSSLVARRITTQHNGLYASPGYLASHGTAKTPAELLNHVGLVLVTSGGEQQQWRLSRGTERWEGLPLYCLSANSMRLQQALSAQGLGIVGLSDSFAENLVKQGALERILPEWDLPSATVWWAYLGCVAQSGGL